MIWKTLVSLQNQVKVLRLQDKSGKQNFHGDVKKVFETVTETIEDASQKSKKKLWRKPLGKTTKQYRI